MSWKFSLRVVTTSTFIVFSAISVVNAQQCPEHQKTRTFSSNDSGESLEGPLCVSVSFNALRYTAALGRTVSYTAGPNLQAGYAAPAKAGGATPPPNADLQAVKDALAIDQNTFLAFDSDNRSSLAKITQTNTDIRALVSSSDDILRSSGPAGVIMAARNAPIPAEIATAAGQTWKATDDIYDKVSALQIRASQLLLAATTDADKTAIAAVQQQLNTFQTTLTPSMLAGDKTAAFYKALGIFHFWQNQLGTLTAGSFTISSSVDCPNVFNQNRSVAVSLVQADLLPTFDGTTTSTTTAKSPFVTVTCASPFAVSAGVELSFLKTPTFGLVPSGTAGTNQFGITDTGTINPLPVGMVHWRAYETSSHLVALYGSFGVAAHIQGNASGSSAAEYLTGISFGFLRTIFITPGWHVGKVASLGGGYAVGAPVPSGVTAVPVQSSYKSGFGLAITFTKP